MSLHSSSSSNALSLVVSGLQRSLQALQIQYFHFIKNTINMIKSHRALMDRDLKSDPNTPRELAALITKHGEDLEKSIALASSSLNSPTSQKSSPINLNSFFCQILEILESSSSIQQKKSSACRVFEDIEGYVKISLNQKDEIQDKKMLGSPKLDKFTWNTHYEELTEENKKLKEENKNLEEKILTLKTQLREKNKKFKEMNLHLNKIKKMHENSFQMLKEQSGFSVGDSSPARSPLCISPDLAGKSLESSQFLGQITEKLLILGNNLKNLSKNGGILQEISLKNQSPECQLALKTFKFDSEQIERTIEDIITPRFQGEISERTLKSTEECGSLTYGYQKMQLESVLEELKAKEEVIGQLKVLNETKTKEIRQLNVFLMKTKRNFEVLGKENDTLKEKIEEIEKKNKGKEEENKKKELSLEDSRDYINKLDFSPIKPVELELCTVNVVSILSTYKNDNLIKEIRKQLMAKERELFDKNQILQKLQRKKEKCDQAVQTVQQHTEDYTEKTNRNKENQLITNKISEVIKEKLSLQDMLNESYKINLSLKGEIEELAKTNEFLHTSCANYRENHQNIKKNLKLSVQSRIFINPSYENPKASLKCSEDSYKNIEEAQKNLLIAELESCKIAISNFSSESVHYLKKISDLEGKMQEKNQNSMDLEKKIKVLYIESGELSQQLFEKNNYITTLEKQLASSMDTFRKERESQKVIRKLMSNLREIFTFAQGFSTLISANLNKISLNFAKKTESLINLLEKIKNKKASFNKKLKTLQDAYDTQSEFMQTLLYSCTKTENEVKNMKLLIESLEKEKANLLETRESLINQCNNQSEELVMLKFKHEEDLFNQKEPLSLEISPNSQEYKNFDEIEMSYQKVILEQKQKISELSQKCEEIKTLKGPELKTENLKSYQHEKISSQQAQILELSKKCAELTFTVENSQFFDQSKQNLFRDQEQKISELEKKYEEQSQKFKNSEQNSQQIIHEQTQKLIELEKKFEEKSRIIKKYEEEMLKKLREPASCKSDSSKVPCFSPFVSPRDNVVEQFLDGLKSARTVGEYSEDTFEELTSKVIQEKNSIFNASSYYDNREVTEEVDKLRQESEKYKHEIQEKNEFIKKYEDLIIDLKEKNNTNMQNLEKMENLKMVIQSYMRSSLSQNKECLRLVESLCTVLDIQQKPVSKIPLKLKNK